MGLDPGITIFGLMIFRFKDGNVFDRAQNISDYKDIIITNITDHGKTMLL